MLPLIDNMAIPNDHRKTRPLPSLHSVIEVFKGRLFGTIKQVPCIVMLTLPHFVFHFVFLFLTYLFFLQFDYVKTSSPWFAKC